MCRLCYTLAVCDDSETEGHKILRPNYRIRSTHRQGHKQVPQSVHFWVSLPNYLTIGMHETHMPFMVLKLLSKHYHVLLLLLAFFAYGMLPAIPGNINSMLGLN